MYLVAANTDDFSRTASVAVEDGETVCFGRRPREQGAHDHRLRISWNDRFVSRNHCLARREGDELVVERMSALAGRSKPNAFHTNVLPRNREELEEPLRLAPGGSLAIGSQGKTSLYWLAREEDIEEQERLYGALSEEDTDEFLESLSPQQDYDAVEMLDDYSLRLQLKLIQQDLPEQVLSGWSNEEELLMRASVFLENALPGQKGVTAAFIAVEAEADAHPRDRSGRAEGPDAEGGQEPPRRVDFELLNPDPLSRADFRPSRTLLGQLNLHAPKPTDIHIWTSREQGNLFTSESLGDQIDWIAAVPVALLDESATVYRDPKGRPVYLYVETRQASERSAASFIPFLRLVSSIVASLISAREEQRAQDRISTYFSPGLRKVMRSQDQSRLDPAMVDCTIMFADRRGHSRVLEMAKSDEDILDRLEENQRVVGIITEEVFYKKGVITDFAGDGALGLWGWPDLGGSSREHALNAVQAAENIVRNLADWAEYEEEHSRKMAAVRIGIATGRLAVGKTGPSQQWHISVFGSVANLGARLERIAKEFRVPVLISDETYCRIEGYHDWRFRKLGYVRPLGFEESYPIYEMILPREIGGSGATPGDVKLYEQALVPFASREWDECIQMLEVLSEDDAPARWLMSKAQSFRKNPPPEGWAGEVRSLSK